MQPIDENRSSYLCVGLTPGRQSRADFKYCHYEMRWAVRAVPSRLRSITSNRRTAARIKPPDQADGPRSIDRPGASYGFARALHLYLTRRMITRVAIPV